MELRNKTGDVILTVEEDNFLKTDFYRKSLPDGVFQAMDLTRVRFYGCDLTHANFRDCKLRWVNFQVANLKGADLSGSDLAYANLIGTDISDADLTNTNLSRVVFKGTKYNGKTKFPMGFNPAKEEMINLDQTAVAV